MICITPFFNPCGYQSLVDNYFIFAERMEKQCQLLTIEVAFNDDFFLISDSIKLRSHSVMWLKERLINYVISLLPENSTYAWIDADVILPDKWVELAEEKLKDCDLVQLFKNVYYLNKNGDHDLILPGIVYQSKSHRNWLSRRENRELPFSAPGFAWAGKNITLYDKDIVGSGDCILVDAVMGTWKLHGFEQKFNENMKKDILNWSEDKKNLKVDYISVDAFHLHHGDLKNRQYMKRHAFLKDFDHNQDIILKNGVYEWSECASKEMKIGLKEYFSRRHDDN